MADDATVLRVTRVDPSGAVDPAYGTGGHFEDHFPFPPLIGVEPDGRVLVLPTEPFPGDTSVHLVRYDATGQREGSPDGGGVPVTQLDTYDLMYVAPSGQIYEIGTLRGLVAIARLLPTLEPDPDFGDAGVALGPAADAVQSFLVDPDGKMVVVGVSIAPSWFVARFWP